MPSENFGTAVASAHLLFFKGSGIWSGEKLAQTFSEEKREERMKEELRRMKRGKIAETGIVRGGPAC
jgi:hypothetical protein